jgi:superfamily II RNA helicase
MKSELKRLTELMQITSGEGEKADEFKAKAKVLVHYNHFDQHLRIQERGIAANEILPTDKVLTVELLFSGILEKMSNEECVALISCLISTIKVPYDVKECTSKISSYL